MKRNKNKGGKKDFVFPEVEFFIGDMTKNFLNGDSFDYSNSSSSKREDKESHQRFMKVGGDRAPFADVGTCMFALHYAFGSKESVMGLLKNIRENIKDDGYFIACCFDGVKVFNMLRDLNLGESKIGTKGGKIIWKLTRAFTQDEFNADESSIGYGIDVFMPSIGQTIKEYLVHPDYLVEQMNENGFRLVDTKSIKTLGGMIGEVSTSSKLGFEQVYGSLENINKNSDFVQIIKNISPEEKELSFLNNLYIFQKTGKQTAKEESKVIPSKVAVKVAKKSDIKAVDKEDKNKEKLIKEQEKAEEEELKKGEYGKPQYYKQETQENQKGGSDTSIINKDNDNTNNNNSNKNEEAVIEIYKGGEEPAFIDEDEKIRVLKKNKMDELKLNIKNKIEMKKKVEAETIQAISIYDKLEKQINKKQSKDVLMPLFNKYIERFEKYADEDNSGIIQEKIDNLKNIMKNY